MRRMVTLGSTLSQTMRTLARGAKAVATQLSVLGVSNSGPASAIPDHSISVRIAVPDGGSEEFPTGDDREETQFVWGAEREPSPGEMGDAVGYSAGGDPAANEERLADAIEERLDDIAEAADTLSMLATNANLKLARDEPQELASIASDVEAEARTLRRTVVDVECQVDQLRRADLSRPTENRRNDDERRDEDERRADDERRSEHGGRGGDERPARPAPVHTDEGDGLTTGRSSVQLPAGDRQRGGPWRAAGVDLTRWPGHLATMDFETAKDRVRESETVSTGHVPPDVAGYSLDEEELSIDSLLALATGGGGERISGDSDSSRRE